MSGKTVLFLDDDVERHARFVELAKGFRQPCHIDYVLTAEQAIYLLERKRYTVAFLDHDLGGKQYVDSECEEPTGYTVCKAIMGLSDPPRSIIVHSHNPVGAKNMLGLLGQRLASIAWIPFGWE